MGEPEGAAPVPDAAPGYPLKRALDVVVSLTALTLVLPVLLAVAAAIKWDSPGPVLYRGLRVGQAGRRFRILKFRTMVADREREGPAVTASDDPRVTRVGGWLRRTRLDELPQLVNVLRGQMSVVGPRPEAPEFVARRPDLFRRLLRARPGLMDLATLSYLPKEEALGHSAEVERRYVEEVMPGKLALSERYLATQSLSQDVRTMLLTARALLSRWRR